MCGATAALVRAVVVAFSSLGLILAATPARAEPAPPLTTRLTARADRASGWSEDGVFRSSSNEIIISPGQSRGPLSLIVLGAGVASAGAGTFFALRNSSANSDYNNAQTAAARAEARDRAQSSATIANVSWVTSGVLIAAGLGMLFLTDW